MPSSYVQYHYVLETGAGWRGTIGRAEIVMRLPYDVTPMNLESCRPDCTYSGKEIRWHFEDFEPTNNIRVSILSPAAWQKIQTETRLTQANPRDGEAWGRLGKAYKEAIWSRRGWYRVDEAGKEMYALSQAAYEQAVTLLPGDADWHYGFAQLLCWNAEWGWPDYPGRNLENWRGCADQLRQTLALNPRHSKGTELLDYLVLLQSNMVTDE